MNIHDPYELLQTLIPEGNKVFFSHNDLRGDYGDHSIFRMAYQLLSRRFKNIFVEGNVKSIDLGYNKGPISLDKEYLHSLFDLEEMPESKTFDTFEALVRERLKDSDFPQDVDMYVGRGGGYLFDSYDWISLHRMAEMLYYINKGVPVGLLPSTIYFADKKLLNLFLGVAKKCKFIVAREPITYSWLTEVCGLRDNVYLAWDLSLLETPKEVPKEGKIGVILTTDKVQTKDFEKYIEKNPNLIFFSTSPKKDERRLRYSAVETGGEYRYILGIDHLLSVIGTCDAVITDRYHGIVFSYLESVPVFALKDRLAKSRGFLEMARYYKPLLPLEHR